MRVISYNLRENHASGELVGLVERFDPDVLCLQECATGLPEHIGGLRLAGATMRNRLGLALYYRQHRFETVATKAFALKKSLHDHLLAPAHERLVGTRLVDAEAGREIVMASFHAAPLTAANSLRRAQIDAAHAMLRDLGPGLPTLMVGDFNYPWFQKSLRARMMQSGYELSRSDTTTYARYKYFRGHFDFATSTGLRVDAVETLPAGASDHKPILVSAAYKEGAEAAA
ncbi:endonuclease/exonuclease/phosphatase family protein [Gryllotalpicola ginsengisoli]|uniref:endonuclease/exonuclease/phosphatase family protein n=1 Tax=Gryllotalpicola ginsengisoli TaxID=444608 RepID=UPI00048814EF|nr:endonuclease/exonuclease/phosphatase family protein [Gryllotalpicola ginsengisoli]